MLARRLLTPDGELDLVLLEGSTLVVCEVKTGTLGPRFRPAMRVARRDLARRRRAARTLAARLGARRARVDVVEVLAGGPGRGARVALHRDVGRFADGGRPPWEGGLR